MAHLRSVSFLLSLLVCCLPRPAVAMDDWQPISQDDLKMAFDPAHPMDAVILYHEETADDNTHHAYYYKKVKILTEKGKEWATVHIVYDAGYVNLIDIKARTIAPDGTITPFTDKPLDSVLTKGHGIKYQAKTLNLPNVQVGSIIEWKYTEYWEDWLHGAHWSVQDELFQKHAKFAFVPYFKAGHYVRDTARDTILDRVYYSFIGLPPNTSIKTIGDNKMELELKDIPAFEEEDFAPPPDFLKMRVNFYYGTDKMGKPEEFWKDEGKYWSKSVEKAFDHAAGAASVAKETVSPSDTAEQKVRKIYARIQKFKNLSFARKEGSLEDIASRKEKRTLEDALHDNEGYRDELVYLFVAMVRAVGVPAYVMRVSDRDRIFFRANVPDPHQLTSDVAVVNVDGKEVYLDPGTPMCPYGLLAWQHTATQGLRQNAGGGTELAQTKPPEYKDAVSKRVGRLALAADGSLSGKIALAWNGEEALSRRLNGLKTDEAGRKKEMEDELKRMLPSGSTVHLDSLTGWEDPEKQITAWFTVEVPSFAASTGKRMLVPTALFEARSRQPFSNGERKQVVYFAYPFFRQDDVQISFPAGFAVENVPQTPTVKTDFAYYRCQRSASANQISVNREFAMVGIAFPTQAYDDLRKLYAGVTAGDSEQVVLTAAGK